MGEGDEFDLYDALDLPQDASADDVRAAFRDLSRVYHPDKQAGNGGCAGGEAAFMRIHRAYRILGDDVLRAFYDRYGLTGVRLAESLSDEDDVAEESASSRPLSLPEDRVKILEARVLQLVRRHEELRAQRLLALTGVLTLSLSAGPDRVGSYLRRRYRMQYSATSQSVQIALSERLKVSLGCASHIQGANGLGVAKLMLGGSWRSGAFSSARLAMNVTGATPEVEAALVRSISPHVSVCQKASVSREGTSLGLAAYSWLSTTCRGSLSWSLGADPSCSINVVKRSSSSGHSVRLSVAMRPAGGELGASAKYKPSRDFSLKVEPSLSTSSGLTVGLICTKSLGDELTKLQWALRLRARGLSARFTFNRAGLRFAIPIELWCEAAGPVPPSQLGLAVALWAAPPFAIRSLSQLGGMLCSLVRKLLALGTRSTRTESTAKTAEAREEGADLDAQGMTSVSAQEQQGLIRREAERRRSEETACRGLEIVCARFGDPLHVCDKHDSTGSRVIEVTDCLMAKVRRSQLYISTAPKSSLLGFYDPVACSDGQGNKADSSSRSVLWIHYRFGGRDYRRTFQDCEAVLLP
eukprot:gnl/TRDRNA2_/TRDRNA2_38954_c0_seq1.p1 gnl/TRDRNA2_/TRDRNA2_38954_c0~~gnl/TRDRNA2_/TRDRNA2_38954_c0_seq1.p1  ORF type:complete len:582 (+),score=80.45 gnl/TRDRNA2_/TRDRNA2_38954_c0_seq1:154-1899(+)